MHGDQARAKANFHRFALANTRVGSPAARVHSLQGQDTQKKLWKETGKMLFKCLARNSGRVEDERLRKGEGGEPHTVFSPPR